MLYILTMVLTKFYNCYCFSLCTVDSLVQEYAQYAFTIPGIHSFLFVKKLPRYAHYNAQITFGYLSKEETIWFTIYYKYVWRQTHVRVSGVSTGHHQEVQLYEFNNLYLLVIFIWLFVDLAG